MARWQAEAAGVVDHRVADLSVLKDLVAGASALTDESLRVPNLEELTPAQRSQPPTYVPNRNLVMLAVAAAYAEAREILWVQEEPANMGALFFVQPRLSRLCCGKPFRTVKRSASASPATSSMKAHALEQAFAGIPALWRPLPDVEKLAMAEPALKSIVTHPPLAVNG